MAKKIRHSQVEGLGDPTRYAVINHNNSTIGNNINFNSIAYPSDNTWNLQPVHTPNYTGQTNYPFMGYGSLLTIPGTHTVFGMQIAMDQFGNLYTRGNVNANAFTSPWKRNLNNDDAATYVNINTYQAITAQKLFTGATSNNWTIAPILINGSSGVFPAIGFHQPGLYASAISLRPDGFHFRGDSTGVSETINAAGVRIPSVNSPEYVLTSDGQVAHLADSIINDNGILRHRNGYLTVYAGDPVDSFQSLVLVDASGVPSGFGQVIFVKDNQVSGQVIKIFGSNSTSTSFDVEFENYGTVTVTKDTGITATFMSGTWHIETFGFTKF